MVEGVTMAKQKLRCVEVRSDPAGFAPTLRIHDKNGRFREERTYPRSADPRHSKG
jgi:hypothetical protein